MVRDGELQQTLIDVQDLAEITNQDIPGERLVAYKNPFLRRRAGAQGRIAAGRH